MASMSLVDILSSIAWIFSTAAVPYREVAPYYGAKGSYETCVAQGFFLQFSFTSIMLNVSLTIYYYCCIVLKWRRTQIKSIVPYLHGLPYLIGLTLAFAGIPFYTQSALVCHMYIPEFYENVSKEVRWLQIVPIFLSIGICTCLMILILLHIKMANFQPFCCGSNTSKFHRGEIRRESSRTIMRMQRI